LRAGNPLLANDLHKDQSSYFDEPHLAVSVDGRLFTAPLVYFATTGWDGQRDLVLQPGVATSGGLAR
jgi:hypothetical protein